MTIAYLDRSFSGRISERAVRGVLQELGSSGDILVFLPGRAEIMQAKRMLSEEPALAGWLILPLLGELSAEEQDRAIFPDLQGASTHHPGNSHCRDQSDHRGGNNSH